MKMGWKAASILVVLAMAMLSGGALLAGDEATANLDVKLSVKGMTCSGCAKSVQAALQGIPGVKKAEVMLDKNEAAVTYEKGKTTPEDLVKAVEKAGYKCSLKKEDHAGA
jgi:mercuric transport protein